MRVSQYVIFRTFVCVYKYLIVGPQRFEPHACLRPIQALGVSRGRGEFESESKDCNNNKAVKLKEEIPTPALARNRYEVNEGNNVKGQTTTRQEAPSALQQKG